MLFFVAETIYFCVHYMNVIIIDYLLTCCIQFQFLLIFLGLHNGVSKAKFKYSENAESSGVHKLS
jgi:hypothetical protein